MTEVRAIFSTLTDAKNAAKLLSAEGMTSGDIAIQAADSPLVEETAREAQTMVRIVLIIAGASVVGTAIGVALGVVLHVLVGPEGTSGLIVQVVSWAIFAHLLIGMWAGYLLLADRTEREIGRARPVMLVIQCANIEPDTVRSELHRLGATDVRESARPRE